MSDPIVVVTGATGLIGNGIVHALVQRNKANVRALVRDVARARQTLPAHVELVCGDVATGENLDEAFRGATLAFHAAGMPEQWQRDDSVFDRVNRVGTKNALSAALRAGVQRVVYTSTMDVFAAPTNGILVETNIDPNPKKTAYERSKQGAEREALALEKQGLDVVYVNPGSVYGPSPAVSTLNKFFVRLLTGKIPLLPPGGMPVAYIDGVVQVHLAAAERGQRGERYLVADEHATMRQLAQVAFDVAASARALPQSAPAWLVRLLAEVSAPVARLFGTAPLVAPGELAFLLWNVRVDAGRAERELGFVPTPLRQGLAKTIAALRVAHAL